MRRTAYKVQTRHARLLEHLDPARWTSVEDIAARTGVSGATVRRDLKYLESKGMVRREYGAARLVELHSFEPYLADPGFREQVHHMADEKRRIGLACARLVADGETIAIAPGTTTGQVAHALRARRNLIVVTNAVNIAMEFSRQPDFAVHLTGGYLSGNWFAMVGPRALEFIATMFPDKFIFGANGIHPERGITDRHTEEAAVNGAMAKQARRRIVVADHTKFGEVARCLLCPIQDVNTIVTDCGATDEMIQPFLARGIEVLRV